MHCHNRGKTGIDTEKGREFQIQIGYGGFSPDQQILVSSVCHDNVVATKALQDQEKAQRRLSAEITSTLTSPI